MERTMTLSVPEAAELLGIGVGTCYRLCREHAIEALRLGKKVRIPRAVIERMLQVERKAEAGT